MGTVSGAGTYLAGTSVTTFASAKPGYIFLNWTEAGTPVSTQTNYTLTVVTNRNLRANFAVGYTIAASVLPTTGGTVVGAGSYPAGAAVQLVATPAASYAFVNWTENGAHLTNSPNYEFILNSNRTVVAHFEPAVATPPQLSVFKPQPDTLIISWPTNAAGFVLQENSALATTNWVTVTNAINVSGTNSEVTLSPLTGAGFFRLVLR
jgi:hypothetical protein